MKRRIFRLNWISKGKFIKLKGRAAWERMPKHAIMKDGKRAYITREAFEDNLWLAQARS